MASYLLQENGDKIFLEDGSGFILLELSVSGIIGESVLDLDSMTCVISENMGNFIAVDSKNLGDFNCIDSLNLEKFKVITDG